MFAARRRSNRPDGLIKGVAKEKHRKDLKNGTGTTKRKKSKRKRHRSSQACVKAILIGSAVCGMACFSAVTLVMILLGSNQSNDSNRGGTMANNPKGVRAQAYRRPNFLSRLRGRDDGRRIPHHSTDDDTLLPTDLYDAIFTATDGGKTDTDEITYDRKTYELTATYSAAVTERGCNLTVVFMDPRLPMLNTGKPAWFALESVAAFAPYACVLLQTAFCEVKDRMERDGNVGDTSVEAAKLDVASRVYDRSLPLFRGMIERGQVRLSFPDHEKYNFKSCSDFYNPSWALMNVNYWNDEFIDDVDSDLVLVIQDDAVLCQPLNADAWVELAYVGGVWPPKSTSLNPVPLEGMCQGMPARWKSWTLPQRRWEKQQQQPGERREGDKHPLSRPPKLLDPKFPPVCKEGAGPVGNGGLSLRSRRWLIEAITTCPHIKYSGIDTAVTPLACKVIDDVNEDFYFGTVLRGIKAPLPTAFDASLFAMEMLWPEEVLRLYGGPVSEDEQEEAVRNRGIVRERGGTSGSSGDDIATIPIGMHKPWWYQPNDLLLSTRVSSDCPYLKYVFSADDTRWHEFREEASWQGIGT